MSGFDRIERRLPEVMAELAPATVPDYFDDLLGQTRHTRQRPAWASFERWLPMDVVARPTVFRAPALRPLLILLVIGLLVAATLAVYIGTRPARLPEPFGPARNGVIGMGTPDGDIVAVDPVTGATSPVIAGPPLDGAPLFSRDGTQFTFFREDSSGSESLWIANADGSGARELLPVLVDWFEWSPDGERAVILRGREASILNVADGTTTALDVPFQIHNPVWRPGRDEILSYMDLGAGKVRYYLINADGTGLREVEGVAADAVNQAAFSPDGARMTYSTWGTAPGSHGRVHVLDLESGVDLVIPSEPFESSELSPQFSPDGTQLVYERYSADPSYEDGYRLVVAPFDGSGTGRPLGPVHGTSTGGAQVEFSPDGTQLLVTYTEDDTTWLLGVDGGLEQELDSRSTGLSWQRLAP